MALASLSLPGKWRSFRKSLARKWKGVAMVHGLPLPEGRVEGDHGLSPSFLDAVFFKGMIAWTTYGLEAPPPKKKTMPTSLAHAVFFK